MKVRIIWADDWNFGKGLILEPLKPLLNDGIINVGSTATLLAHDIVEHITPVDGTPENELQALGVAWITRGIHNAFAPSMFSPYQHLASDVTVCWENLQRYFDGRPLQRAPLQRIKGALQDYADDVDEIFKLFSQADLEGTHYDERPTEEAIAAFMKYGKYHFIEGIRKGLRRYGSPLHANRVFTVVERALSQHFDKSGPSFSEHEVLTVSFNIKTPSAKAHLHYIDELSWSN